MILQHFDENLNLWFLECNTSPVLKGTSVEKEKFLVKMLKDHYEIIFGLLRSRMKRLIRFINSITGQIRAANQNFDSIMEKNVDNLRRQFKIITKNRFEPEFMPGPENGFYKIIDENLNGTARYAGLIAEDCV